MSKTKPEDTAFARPHSGNYSSSNFKAQVGLTKLEYFTAAALQGLLANGGAYVGVEAQAVKIADICILRLNEYQDQLAKREEGT